MSSKTGYGSDKMLRSGLILVIVAILTFLCMFATMAKYVTSGNFNDDARVAKWGINIPGSADIGLFKAIYKGVSPYDASETVHGKDGDKDAKVVAPGTDQSANIIFDNQSGRAPEVLYDFVVDLQASGDASMLKELDKISSFSWYFDAPNGDKWDNLKFYDYGSTKGLQNIIQSMTRYNVEPNRLPDSISLGGAPAPAAGKTFVGTIGWKWAFNGDDKADTRLGNLVAEGKLGGITLNLTINAKQKIDTDIPTVDIKGKVVNQFSEPIEGAEVTFTTTENKVYGPVYTDADGMYVISDVTKYVSGTLTFKYAGQTKTEQYNADGKAPKEEEIPIPYFDIKAVASPAEGGSVKGLVTDVIYGQAYTIDGNTVDFGGYGKLEADASAGWEFNGWEPATSGTVTGPMTFTAKFILSDLNVTFDQSQGSHVQSFWVDDASYAPGQSMKIAPGTAITFSVAAEDGYVVDSVFANGVKLTPSASNEYTTTINEDTTILASTQPKTITVSFDPSYSGAPVVPSKDVKYFEAYGDLPSIDREGFIFEGWFLLDQRIDPTTLCTQTSNHTLEAHWTEKRDASFDFDATGDGTSAYEEDQSNVIEFNSAYNLEEGLDIAYSLDSIPDVLKNKVAIQDSAVNNIEIGPGIEIGSYNFIILATAKEGQAYKKTTKTMSFTLTITKAENNIEFDPSVDGSTVVYFDSVRYFDFVAANVNHGDASYSISSQPGGNYFSIFNSTMTLLQVNANTPVGTYVIKIHATTDGDAHYKAAETKTDLTYTLNIEKRENDVFFDPSVRAHESVASSIDQSYEFNGLYGLNLENVSYSIVNQKTDEGTDVNYFNIADTSKNILTAMANTPAGDYVIEIKASVPENSIYKAGDSNPNLIIKWKFDARKFVVTFDQSTGSQIEYFWYKDASYKPGNKIEVEDGTEINFMVKAKDNYVVDSVTANDKIVSPSDTGTYKTSITETTTIMAATKGKEITVTFDPSYEGAETTTKTIRYFEAYGDLPSVERTGYDFVGWYLGDNLIDPTTLCTQTSNHTIYAKWVPIVCSVKFDLQGHGSPQPVDQSINYGSYVSSPIPPQDEKYMFDGWYQESECINPWRTSSEPNPTPVTQKNTTIFAKWTIKKFDVSFSVNESGWGIIDPSEKINVEYGTLISTDDDGTITVGTTTVTPTPSSETAQYKYGFDKWTLASGEAVPTSVTGITDLKANFTRTQWTVTEGSVVFHNNSSHSSELPTDLTRVEYIENTGTSYIDTGYTHKRNTEYSIMASDNGSVNDWEILFGSREKYTSSNAFDICFRYNGTNIGYNIGGATDDFVHTSLSMNTAYSFFVNRNKVVINGGGLSSYTKNITLKQSDYPTTPTFSPSTDFIFGCNQNGKLASEVYKGKVYSFMIFDENGLQRDFVPVVTNVEMQAHKLSTAEPVTAPMNTPGLWDRVEGKLYINCGTGDFNYPKTGDKPTPYLENTPRTADLDGWDNNKAIQRFSADGTTGYAANSIFSEGTLPISSGTSLQAPGYVFKGWNTKADGTGTHYDDRSKLGDLNMANSGVIDLYAEWEAI